jgi:hypothetical protein
MQAKIAELFIYAITAIAKTTWWSPRLDHLQVIFSIAHSEAES